MALYTYTRSLLLAVVMLVTLMVQAQETRTWAGPQFDHSHSGNRYNTTPGVNFEGWFGKHLGVAYSILYVPTGSDQYYFYTGGGQAAGVYLIKEAIKEKSGLSLAIPLGMVSFILPETYIFRFPLAPKSQLAVFISPYGFEFQKNRETKEEDYNISYEYGIRYYFAPNQWTQIAPQIGYKNIYGEEEPGISLGLSVMLKIKKKPPVTED